MITPFDRGLDDYYEAMASPQWTQTTRPAVIARDGGKCRICGCTCNLQVHHIRYQNDRGANEYFNMKYLVTLCASCHQIITEAVKEAKAARVEVPAFMVKPGPFAAQQVENKIKYAAYRAEAELVSETIFKLWQRSLDTNCDRVNMRDLKVLGPIGKIVMDSVEYQAGMTAMGAGVAFAERTITKITRYLAKTYNEFMDAGTPDSTFQNVYKLNSAQMVKVRRNAERLRRTGTIKNIGGGDGD